MVRFHNETLPGDESKTSDETQDLIQVIIPEDFICPYSKEIMSDPVTVPSGVTYNRKSLIDMFDKEKEEKTIPDLRYPAFKLDRSVLHFKTNEILKKQINRFIENENKKWVPRTHVPLPTTYTQRQIKQQLKALIPNPEKHSKLTKWMYVDNQALIDLLNFINHLSDAEMLMDLAQTFNFVKLLYNYEVYLEACQDKSLAQIKEFSDTVFGERSAAFRELCSGSFKEIHQRHFRSNNTSLKNFYGKPDTRDQLFSHIDLTIFAKTCSIPVALVGKWAIYLRKSNYSNSHKKLFCQLTPNYFDIGYLESLRPWTFAPYQLHEWVKIALQKNEYAADVLYGFYWLMKGEIASPDNKIKVLNHAENVSRLSIYMPPVAELPTVEKQEKFQKVFDNFIKESRALKSRTLLEGIKSTQKGCFLWGLFGTKEGSQKPNHPIGDLQVLKHIISFL